MRRLITAPEKNEDNIYIKLQQSDNYSAHLVLMDMNGELLPRPTFLRLFIDHETGKLMINRASNPHENYLLLDTDGKIQIDQKI